MDRDTEDTAFLEGMSQRASTKIFYGDSFPRPTRAQLVAITGIILSSSLYLLTVFAAAIMTGNSTAWHFAVATFGVNYLAFSVQLLAMNTLKGSPTRHLGQFLVVLSIVLGLFAGITL